MIADHRLRRLACYAVSVAESDVAMPGAGHLFLKPATPPSYLHCANAPTCTTIEYKSGTRAHIASEGYRIVADFGDQYGDLLGGHAGHQVKIPNPMYYIP